MDITLEKRADDTVKRLKELITYSSLKIDNISYYSTPELIQPEDLDPDSFEPCQVGFTWNRDRATGREDRMKAEADLLSGGELPVGLSLGNSTWFRLEFSIPNNMKSRPVYLKFAVRPLDGQEVELVDFSRPGMEALCYRDGKPWQGFDEGRDELLLTEEAGGGERFELLVEAGTTMGWGGLEVEKFRLKHAELYSERPQVKRLFWTYKLLNDLRKDLDENSQMYGKLLRGLNDAYRAFPIQSRDEEELREGAREALFVLEPLTEYTSDLSGFNLVTSGHAHIDAAWLWPWSETVRKVGRTFSNVLKLMEEYPELHFIQSQPHLYEFAKNRYPSIFEKINGRVEEGRWEPTGALWVESDVNIPGGESLARQYLLGKRYFRKEFGIDPKITFIPDVFGYTPSLPGVSKAAGCPYFFTQKMCWNEVNEIPNHAFRWEGIDGSEVLAHFLPTDTYNGMVTVEEVNRTARNFKEGDIISEIPYLIGWGDGGGGPTREMLEKMETINRIDYLPNLTFGPLKEVFSELEEYRPKLKKWVGELYLERHRGTLTTQGKTKRNNRRAEFALREAELWAVVGALRKKKFNYPKGKLNRMWKIVLFNQFHDILPGSSIKEVYEDAARDYQEVFTGTSTVIDRALSSISPDQDFEDPPADYLMVANSLSWSRTSPVKTSLDVEENDAVRTDDGEVFPLQKSRTGDGSAMFIGKDLPALGVKTFSLVKTHSATETDLRVGENKLENACLNVELSKDGLIGSVYDKQTNREVLGEGKGNDLRLYRDIPTEFDAWELEGDIYENWSRLDPPRETEIIEDGPVRAVLRQTRKFGDSRMVQDITLYSKMPRVDFVTGVKWAENDKLLKVHFPIGVHADRATYEVQYGHYTRPTHNNTSWDEARFEVPHQKWVDVSEYGYGAALLNNCKYGVNVDGSEINLSLLRAPNYPDDEADRGEHEFTYSLFPHSGDFRESGVIKQAYQLNVGARTKVVANPLDEFSLLDIEDDGVIVEAVKQSEDRESVVFRLYEAWGRSIETEIDFAYKFEEAYEVNLIEDRMEEIPVNGNSTHLEFSPFEIKSVEVFFSE